MAKDLQSLEQEILETVRGNGPTDPSDLFSQRAPEIGAFRQALRSLLNRGDLDMTLDWKLRVHGDDLKPEK